MEPQRDVAAVVFYQFDNFVEVVYNKNRLTDACERHVEQLVNLIKSLAGPDTMSWSQFVQNYFQLMLTNARAKLLSRRTVLRKHLTWTPPFCNCRAISIESLLVMLEGGFKERIPYLTSNRAAQRRKKHLNAEIYTMDYNTFSQI